MKIQRVGFDSVANEKKNTNSIFYPVLAACNTYIFYFGIIFLIAILLSIPVEGAVMPNSTVYVSHFTDESITWNYSYSNVTLKKGSLDGIEILDFDNTSYVFTADKLSPASYHIFCIYSSTAKNCEGGMTAIDSESDNTLIGLIYNYVWWLIAVILLIAAIGLKSRMLGFISAISCLIGMVRGITDSSFIVFMLYVVTFIAAYLISEDLKTG